jgi:AAA15 family ATPase/GTPase
MLENIEIGNYRSCQKAGFRPRKGLSTIIGPNGAGKTNILSAILLLQKLCSHRTADDESSGDIPPNESVLKATFNLNGKYATLTAKIGTYTDELNNDIIVNSSHSWYMPDFTTSRQRIKTPLWAFGERFPFMTAQSSYERAFFFKHFQLEEKAASPLVSIHEFLTNIKYYSASQFTNPSLCPVSFEMEKDGRRIRRSYSRTTGHAKFLYDLYKEYKKDGNTSYAEFIDIVGPNGINLIDKLEFKEISTSSIDYTVRSGGKIRQKTMERLLVIPQFHIGSNILSPNQLSEGTFKTITLLFYLITETSSLLLIEEPEVCVHHGLLSSIIELIKSYSQEKQLILSTHSDFVLDHVDPEDVFCVKNLAASGTKIQAISSSMSSRDYAALRTYLAEEGNLGEYWRGGGMD